MFEGAFKKNVEQSFLRAKKDIYDAFNLIAQLQKRVDELEDKLRVKEHSPIQPKYIVASRKSRIAHQGSCVFAKNIKASNARVFNSIENARASGREPCSCLSHLAQPAI